MIVNSATEIQSNLLAGNPEYTPNYIFVEFHNGSGTMEIQDVAATDTKEHYTNLSGEYDYLAIPITIKPRLVPASDTVSRPYVVYSVVTSGFGAASGVHGKDFTDAAGSKIYSLGLISRLKSDGTNDILFARTNLSSTQQLLKTTSDMYISWKIEI